jgi:hypothetical protein
MQFCVSLVQRVRRKKITFLHPELTKLKTYTVRVIDINLTISTPKKKEMCHSLNRKCPIIGKDKLRSLLNEQYVMTQTKVKMIMKGQSFAFTTDGWTSLANVGYVTCTAHLKLLGSFSPWS